MVAKVLSCRSLAADWLSPGMKFSPRRQFNGVMQGSQEYSAFMLVCKLTLVSNLG
jgi:hypothetical protein